jgi:hypothetical protein
MKKALSEIRAMIRVAIVKRTLRLCALARNNLTQRRKNAKENTKLNPSEIFTGKSTRRAIDLFNPLAV